MTERNQVYIFDQNLHIIIVSHAHVGDESFCVESIGRRD